MNRIYPLRHAAALLMAALSSLPLLSAQTALAQSTPVASMTVDEIRACLCLQPTLQPQQDEWRARQQTFDEHQSQLAVIDQQVVEQRKKLDPNDVVGQQVLKDLLAQQQELRDAIQSQLLPAVVKARNAYNDAVMRYNGTCTKPRYSIDEATARQNLSCPAP